MAFKGKDTHPDKHTGFTFRGQEIILSKTRGRPLMNKHWKKGYYTDKQRIEAATIFAATGSPKRVYELTGVSESAVRGWVKEQWFQALLDEIRAENDHVIDAKFNELIHGALEQIGDRIKYGDNLMNKHGEIVRIPVKARDLAIVAAINIDKRQLLRGKPTSRTEQVTNQSIDARLKQLAENFEKVAQKKLPQEQVIDAEVIE